MPLARSSRRAVGAGALAAVIALAAGCGSSPKGSSTSTTAKSSSGGTESNSTAFSNQPVVFKVTGNAPAGSITVLVGNEESQHTNVPLPYTYRTLDNQIYYGITVQGGGNGTTVTCEIDVPGVKAVSNTSTGNAAVVICSSAPPGY